MSAKGEEEGKKEKKKKGFFSLSSTPRHVICAHPASLPAKADRQLALPKGVLIRATNAQANEQTTAVYPPCAMHPNVSLCS